jgi:hypothetical protein
MNTMQTGAKTMGRALPDFRNRYSPAERKAIIDHKYLLGIDMHCDPGLGKAVESWERNYALQWRSQQMRHDAEAQIAEIESYRHELMLRLGREVDFNEAARQWVDRWGEAWRRQRDEECREHERSRQPNNAA